MQLRNILAATALMLGAAFAPFGSACADTVLYDNSGFVQGSQSFVDSFTVTTPGTLTISLADVPWLDTLSGLNLFLTTASGPMGASMMGAGTESMQVGPGTFYAHWFGDANGQYKVGVYSLEIMFHPEFSAVPVPASLILLLSGLGLMFAWPSRRSASKVALS
jgi:hypothetical protein